MKDRSLTDMDYFRQEVAAYERLSNLQGEYIPKVYGSYEGVEERFGVILMEILKGAFDQDVEKMSFTSREKAVVALKKVHESGVLHGDIRTQNFYFGSERVYLLDFSHARVCDCGDHQSDMNYEIEEARVILGLSGAASPGSDGDPCSWRAGCERERGGAGTVL
ncbi:hypothetical protein BT69DRAFT_1089420 [Atractiella rhizophila]|nr:hypothetical protein BT69DRAFT_1089420 [Atractiella rhizophila]